tara:strand:+ start:405 stop:596 length:192 start_codon:yes stop_codon:yes gene_type:complete
MINLIGLHGYYLDLVVVSLQKGRKLEPGARKNANIWGQNHKNKGDPGKKKAFWFLKNFFKILG